MFQENSLRLKDLKLRYLIWISTIRKIILNRNDKNRVLIMFINFNWKSIAYRKFYKKYSIKNCIKFWRIAKIIVGIY